MAMTERSDLKDSQRVALVTGASSGFGFAIAESLQRRGIRVFGTSRSGGSGPRGVQMLALDVDRDDSVRACVTALQQRASRVDILVNNAGRAMVGACEETSADEARALFETNVFGVMRVTSAILPLMHAQQGGSIVNVGSLSGFVGVPFHGVYAASKHALAGYTDALRHETRQFGIRVALVEPGAHRTTIQMAHPADPQSHYDVGRRRVEAIIGAQIERGAPAQRVAEVVVRAATAASPRMRYRVGGKGLFAEFAVRVLPWWLLERVVRREFGLV